MGARFDIVVWRWLRLRFLRCLEVVTLLIEEEVDRYIYETPATLAGNVVSFLADNAIERVGLESFALRPFQGDFDLFYVSTVARGLAGSKSDVDLILVAGESVADDTTLSSMLFYSGRRVGVKVFRNFDIKSAIDILQEISTRIIDGDFVSIFEARKRMPVKWIDVERLVNGVSLKLGPIYLEYLRPLCRWVVIDALQEFQVQYCLVRLALASNNFGAASAYALGAIVSAMDAIMATCGRVQSNIKWTLERWRRFTLDAQAPRAREAIRRLMDAKDVAGWPTVGAANDLVKALTNLRAFMYAEFVSPGQLGCLRIDIPDGGYRAPFLPGADGVFSQNTAAVVNTLTLNRILGADSSGLETLDSREAKDTLELLQAGVLSFKIV